MQERVKEKTFAQSLLHTIQRLLAQSHSFDKIYIVDNNSQDGTYELLRQKDILKNKIIVWYKLNKNLGGAGGFHYGIKKAYEEHFDLILCIDDDGMLERNAIEEIVKYREKQGPNSVVGCLVLNKNNRRELAFPVSLKTGKTFSLSEVLSNSNLIKGCNPFNGVLFPRKVIQKVGLPNKHFFIKGDEKDYNYRISKEFDCFTCKSALLFHPKPKFKKVDFLGKKFNIETNNLKSYYYLRNLIWLSRKYSQVNPNIGRIILKSIIIEPLLVKYKIVRLVSNLKAIFYGLFASKKVLYTEK